MNYSHSFHAGGFADVFKHTILITLIKSLLRKENPYCFLDTHAGAGFYDLDSEAAKKNKEFENGIGKVLAQKHPPELVKLYLNCVQRMNNKLMKSTISSLRYYPGSPAFAKYFLRAQDRVILSELHPKEFQLLKNYFSDRQISTHLMDGYQGLKAFLPPKERRGLIFIDPPYERPNELIALTSLLPLVLKRFPTGIYAIWYPIKEATLIDHFHKILKESIKHPILTAEINIYPDAGPLLLNGCGMLIINPPWQLDREIRTFLPWLWKTLSIQHKGQQRVIFL